MIFEHYEIATAEDCENVLSYAESIGARVCFCEQSLAALGSPLWFDTLRLAFVYSGGLFNVTPLGLPERAVTLSDCLGRVNSLPDDNVTLGGLSGLPNGWKLSTWRNYWPDELPTFAADIYRPHETATDSRAFAENWVLHPTEERLLTEAEIAAIFEIPWLGYFLDLQQSQFSLQPWQKDFEAIYSSTSGNFQPYDCSPNQFRKTFNLIARLPNLPPKKTPRFRHNINENGKLIYPWIEIEKAYLCSLKK